MFINLVHCRLLGTPNEQIWPGVTTLRNWHSYPQWKPHEIAQAVPRVERSGVDLLDVSIHHARGPCDVESCLETNIKLFIVGLACK